MMASGPVFIKNEPGAELQAEGGQDLETIRPGDNAQAVEQWTKFLAQCIASRLGPDTFESYITLLYSKYPLPPSVVADVCLKPQAANHESLDPRVPRYIQILSQHKLIDTPSILRALYKYSSSHVQAEKVEPPAAGSASSSTLRWGSSYSAEEVIFYRLTKAVGLGTGIRNVRDAIEVCQIMARWMTLFTSAATAFAQDVMGQLQDSQSRDEMEAARAAFVMLLLSICENQVVLNALSRPFAKEARKAMSQSLASFVPSILQGASQIAGRLELFRTETLAGFEPVEEKKQSATTEINDLLDSNLNVETVAIPELPIVNSRAGLYIYLNAALVSRPLLDDSTFFSYLHNRYQGDIQATTIDLILASFDVLANAVFRREGQQFAHVLRSFLINKLPLWLSTLSTSMFPPLTAEYCITEALTHVDTNAFPTLSAMFDDTSSNNTFTDSVRQDFCFSCCLHGLIPESSIETLLGEITYQTLPTGGRYVKEHLVEQCMADPERTQALIGELDNMDGNVGAVCHALTEVLGRLCTNKETISLKLLCGQLAKKPLSLDVMLLFEKPMTILNPLCELLDNWHYDEDQGEYQPVYEEFGAVLLLLLAFVYRYNLSPSDLGIRNPESFVLKLLNRGNLSRSMDELSEQEKSHLDGWIHGLFDTEAGGLGDELMSSCPPQDFYLLASTLFHNMVLALSANYLTEDSLKSGMEYLVDTFLLPSLVMAMMFLSNQVWADRPQDQKAVIRILQLILLTRQGSTEAQSMLYAVLNLVAKPLEQSLRAYQRQDPKSQDIEPLLKSIKENIKLSRRTGAADHNELGGWTGTANGGLAASVRHTLQNFVQWSLNPGMNITPTAYTHRQMLAALRVLGAKRVLQIILDETKHQTDAGSGSIMYDIATAMVCAPNASTMPAPVPVSLLDTNPPVNPPQARLSLREILKSEAEDFKTIQKVDPVMGESIVRLYRRVEAQLMLPPPAETMLEGDLTLGLDDGTAASLGDALAAAQNDGLVVDDTNVSLDLGGPHDLDLTGAGGSSTGGLDLGGDDDIFGSLGAIGNGSDLLWDSMDLS